MKLLIASDLHGSAGACRAVLGRFAAERADTLVLLGDLLYHGPRNPVPADYDPPAVAALLNGLAPRILAVRGNCDAEVDQMLLRFPMQSDSALLLLPDGRRCFLTHGHVFGPDRLPPLAPGDALLYGHTLVPVLRAENGLLLLNPGSVTFPKEGHPPTCAVWENGVFDLRTLDGAPYRP